MAQRIVNFSGIGLPALDVLKAYDRVQGWVLPPVFLELQDALVKVLNSVRDLALYDEIKQKIGLYTEPWDKYLLLDSAYFMPLFNHSAPLLQFDQLLWLQFLAYTIEEELVSTIKLSPAQILSKFLEFANASKKLRTLRENYLKLDKEGAQLAFAKLNDEINKPFYEELRREGHLKPYREDYEHLMSGSSEAGFRSLSQGESTNPKQIMQERMENLFGIK